MRVKLSDLRAHGLNSNVMPEDRFEKLVGHMGRTGRYPPLVVREKPGEVGAYEVLDGHHRWRALERLGEDEAECVVWEVDDGEAMVLLATLNRLSGVEDAKKRGALLGELKEKLGASVGELAAMVPEGKERLERWLKLAEKPPGPRGGEVSRGLPVAVHFFLSAADKAELEGVLREVGGDREGALMAVVRAYGGGDG